MNSKSRSRKYIHLCWNSKKRMYPTFLHHSLIYLFLLSTKGLTTNFPTNAMLLRILIFLGFLFDAQTCLIICFTQPLVHKFYASVAQLKLKRILNLPQILSCQECTNKGRWRDKPANQWASFLIGILKNLKSMGSIKNSCSNLFWSTWFRNLPKNFHCKYC